MSRRRKKLRSGDGWTLVPAEPTPPAEESPPAGEPRARLSLQWRRGKPVTVVDLEGLEAGRARELGRAIKTRCAAGGKVTAGGFEVQGDHRELTRELLAGEGLEVKG